MFFLLFYPIISFFDFYDIKSYIENGVESIRDKIESAQDTIKEKIGDSVESIRDKYESSQDTIKDKIESVQRKLEEVIDHKTRKSSNKDTFNSLLNRLSDSSYSATKDFGILMEEKRHIYQSFEKIYVDNAINLIIESRNANYIEIKGDISILNHVTTIITDSTLYINTDLPDSARITPITVIVSCYFEISEIKVNGASSVKGTLLLNFGYLNIVINESSSLDLSLKAGILNLDASGLSKVSLSGSVNLFYSDISLFSSLIANNLQTSVNEIKLSGVSNAFVNAQKELSYNVSGSSILKYNSSPKLTKTKCDQTSTVKQSYY